MVDLDAHNDLNQVTQLRVWGLGEYGKGVEVGAAAPVLAAALGIGLFRGSSWPPRRTTTTTLRSSPSR